MPIKDIIGIILLVLVVVALWIYSIYDYNTSIYSSAYETFCIPIFLTLLAFLLIFIHLWVINNPPEKIEENGHTYQLEGFEPEQTIERYGRTYILVEE